MQDRTIKRAGGHTGGPLAVDWAVGMPRWRIVSEGPFLGTLGVLVLWLARLTAREVARRGCRQPAAAG